MHNATHEAGVALLSVEGLTVRLPRLGDRPYAVRDLSFTLDKGEILCIVGESGSGKSICANAIMGLLPGYLTPESGRILYQGTDLLRQSEETLQGLRGRKLGMIFQEPMSALNPIMTVGEQIAEVMAVHNNRPGKARQARTLELLELVGLPEPGKLQHAYPFRLSGGQRQRVMIAMALALEPDILIADEPTTALDVTTQAQILALIKKIQSVMQMGVMFITHDFGVVADIADRVAVMEQGILVEQGPATEVLNRPSHAYTRRLIDAVPHRRSAPAPAGGSKTPEGEIPVLEVRQLTKSYLVPDGLFKKRRVAAVQDVSFTVQRGRTLGIVGESGSGKSTIGKCLLKLVGIDAGQILFNGLDIAQMSQAEFRPMRKNVQMVFQDPFASLNPRHTVGRIVMDGQLANGVPRGEAEHRARELLRLVELHVGAFDRYPGEFSGGQRQRIGIARALALDPQLLVADELLSALDASVQAQVLQLLMKLQTQLHIAMVFITHDLRVAANICHHIAVMHRGRIVEEGTPEQVFTAPRHEYTRKLIAATPGQSWEPPRLALAA